MSSITFLFCNEIVTLSDGQKIIINHDKTWDYLNKKETFKNISNDDFINSMWEIYDNSSERYLITFETDGTFKYTHLNSMFSFLVGSKVDTKNETWKIINNQLIITFGDGHMIMKVNLIDKNEMVGNWKIFKGHLKDSGGTINGINKSISSN
tara:strand:+ start:156 stop:611 length:456 start_codon:yes stop_codon:yes gene_type:complete